MPLPNPRINKIKCIMEKEHEPPTLKKEPPNKRPSLALPSEKQPLKMSSSEIISKKSTQQSTSTKSHEHEHLERIESEKRIPIQRFRNTRSSDSSENDSWNSGRDFSPASDDDREYQPSLSGNSSSGSEKVLRQPSSKKAPSNSGNVRYSLSRPTPGSSSSSSSGSSQDSDSSSSSDSDQEDSLPTPAKRARIVTSDDFRTDNCKADAKTLNLVDYSSSSEDDGFSRQINVNICNTVIPSENLEKLPGVSTNLALSSSSESENGNQDPGSPSVLNGIGLAIDEQAENVPNVDVIENQRNPFAQEVEPVEVNSTLQNELIPSRGRSRTRRGSKRDFAKALRNSGLEYTSSSQKQRLISERCMKSPCGTKCRLKCSERVSQECRRLMFKEYWQMGSLTRQREFINSNMIEIKPKYQYKKMNNNRKPKHGFYLVVNKEKQRVCKLFFKNTLGINDRPIRTVIEKQNEFGFLEAEKRGKHDHHGRKISDANLSGVRHHINTIPRIESHYLRQQTTREYIDGGKNVTDLYMDYKNECIKKNLDHVKIHTYRKVFNSEFNISFFIPKKDQCDLCVSYKNAEGTEKENLEEKYRKHLDEKQQSRLEKERDKALINNNFVVACYDLQAVLPVPRGDVSVFYYKSKLNCYNFTVCELATDHTECFFWNEVEGQRGANEIGTCVLKYLKNKSAASCEPMEVIFYSDNCCGQQKNQFILSMYIYAIKNCPNIQRITHKFLIKGHTQNEGDCAHSTIEKEVKKSLKSGPIYVPAQYANIIKCSKKKGNPYRMNEMSHSEFYDIKSLSEYKFTKNTEGETVKMTDLKIILIEKAETVANRVKVFYKTSYLDVNFKEFKLQRAGRMQSRLRSLYQTKLPLGERKKADILSLIQSNHIPRYYASSYYNNIL